MNKLFLSFSSKDTSHARYFIHLLQYHQFDPYIGPSNDPELRDFVNVSEQALLRCDKLILIVTKNTVSSARVKRELTWFQVLKPEIEILICMFDDVDLNGTIPEQMTRFSIDFQDWMNGFSMLFDRLGVKFLKPEFHSPKSHDLSERRLVGDRRSPNLTNRLYTSMWRRYLRANELSNEIEIRLNTQEFVEYTDSIKSAAKRYLCYDGSGNNYNFEQVMTSTAFEIWYHLKEVYGKNYVKADDLTYDLAQRLTGKYVIRCKDRRNSKDKRYN